MISFCSLSPALQFYSTNKKVLQYTFQGGKCNCSIMGRTQLGERYSAKLSLDLMSTSTLILTVSALVNTSVGKWNLGQIALTKIKKKITKSIRVFFSLHNLRLAVLYLKKLSYIVVEFSCIWDWMRLLLLLLLLSCETYSSSSNHLCCHH